MGTYLLQDPHHEYAVRFIRTIRERFGHRPIGFFTRGRKERYYRRAECPPASEFEALYEADDLRAFAARVRERHPDLAGIVPYSEETLETTAALQELLPGLRWNDAQTLARFRRKAALKDHLRVSAPSLRMNFSARVASAAEVRALGEALPRKFILKPDAGFGSKGVGVFEGLGGVGRFFDEAPGVYVLEEFLEGPVYAVDGLVDERGQAAIVSIFSSGRQHLNGSPVVYADGALVPEDSALFAELAAYGRAVVSASGLLRSPFHMEVIRDARGPCLVEVGARLVGHSHALTCERVHGGALDLFARAAAGYFRQPMDLSLSFARYNAVQALKVYGASTVEGTAYDVTGVEAVEALPCFDRWIVKPRAGARLHRTVDLFTVPYSAVLVAARSAPPLARAGEAVHRMIGFQTAASPLLRARVDAPRFAEKARNKLGWLVERARCAVLNG